ncbi:SDR family oxidoreductase [Protaetiibacter intestinalis]|uniref:SDR family oxidoreductase n=1 Tax=Protaetiibacter intestinalis TaxID=2419774 RepID=A0A387B606_9MICO|nr:SDR family oxidoreductase [Protaetiibacter intestinalis]AYF97171.1 SDR family oxidoreductase [Protaetiibacter intestinalis]
MRIVVVGGTGLIGRQLVAFLSAAGHDAVAASPGSGVDSFRGRGLDGVMRAAEVVVDVSKPHSYDPDEVLDFFTTSTRRLLEAEERAGVRHHLTLSAVGTERLPDSGFYRAKAAQEELVGRGAIPFTLVRSTQFFEFAWAIAGSATREGTVRLPSAPMQPMASRDVAGALASIATQRPVLGFTELAGPEVMGIDRFVRTVLRHFGDPRPVLADASAAYFGGHPGAETLLPGASARLSATTLARWLTGEG